MKRVKAACILQTLVFSQRPELELSKESTLKLNREEAENYKASLIRTKTRHIITSEDELDNGSIILHIKKQYSDKANVDEYFN